MFCICYSKIIKFGLQTSQLIQEIDSNLGYNLFGALSSDNKKLFVNGDGDKLVSIDLEDSKLKTKDLSILKDIPWYLFEISPDE